MDLQSILLLLGVFAGVAYLADMNKTLKDIKNDNHFMLRKIYEEVQKGN